MLHFFSTSRLGGVSRDSSPFPKIYPCYAYIVVQKFPSAPTPITLTSIGSDENKSQEKKNERHHLGHSPGGDDAHRESEFI